jgi:hypothetical protein
MNQLSIIYLIMGSVLLVGVMLISISPDTASVAHQKAEAAVGLSNINSHQACIAGFEEIALYPGLNNGKLNNEAKFYTFKSAYPLGITTEGSVGTIIRKAGGEGPDTPWPFLLQCH